MLLLVAGAGTALGYTYATDTVFRGVTAGTVEVGGLSVAEAQNKIQTEVGPVVETGSIQVKIYDTEYPIVIQDVTTGLDAAASAQAAYDIGHTGGVGERIAGAFGALFGGKTAELVITVDDAALDQRLDEIASEALTEPTGATWELEGTNLILTMPKPGVSFDRDKVRDEVKTKIETMDFTPYEVETQLTDPEPLDVDELKTQVDCEPTNAIVDKSDGKTIIPEKNGIVMDADKAREIIGDGTEATYTIPVTVTPAKVTKEVLDRALFRDVLSSASTSLNTGNVDRTNNVTLAAKYMNGTILNPGEEFSYNGVVGQRTPERGFKAAGAYSNGQLIDEVGGGVCQPSSTLYMAVLRADLEVTERTNHSMTVSYTPLGEDATVSYGSLDFKFKNNTDYPIKLITVREGSQMKVTIMGTKVDDKTVRLETEILETLTPETIKKTDSSLKPGETEVQQSAVTGYKTITYKYVTVNGETTKEVANRSSYRKRDKIVLVGPEATSEPTLVRPRQQLQHDEFFFVVRQLEQFLVWIFVQQQFVLEYVRSGKLIIRKEESQFAAKTTPHKPGQYPAPCQDRGKTACHALSAAGHGSRSDLCSADYPDCRPDSDLYLFDRTADFSHCAVCRRCGSAHYAACVRPYGLPHARADRRASAALVRI